MTAGHVGRTKPPRAVGVFGGSRRLLLASMALPVVAIIPAIMFVVSPPPHDEIETVIRAAGFEPLTPPSRLRGPGALYLVENGIYEKICKEPVLAAAKLQTSPSMDRNLRRLEKGGFSMTGDMVETLNAKLSGARLTSVEYKLTDVTVSEISGDDLLEIQELLLGDRHCYENVHKLVKENKRVCAGASVISATTSYRMQVDRQFEADTHDKASVVKAVQKAMQEDTHGQIQIRSEDELVGEKLFLGIRLYSLCITLDTETEPIPAPPPGARDKTAALQ